MPLTGADITTDFALDLAQKADECELDYGDPVGETLRLLVTERDKLRATLEKISCPHVIESPLWWQRDARKALGLSGDA